MQVIKIVTVFKFLVTYIFFMNSLNFCVILIFSSTLSSLYIDICYILQKWLSWDKSLHTGADWNGNVEIWICKWIWNSSCKLVLAKIWEIAGSDIGGKKHNTTYPRNNVYLYCQPSTQSCIQKVLCSS